MLIGVNRAALTASVAVLGLAGCSLGAHEEPKAARGAPKQVAALVSTLDRATRGRDYRTICDELLTSSARRRAGGRDCARLLRSTARDVRRPRIELLAIEVSGPRARARVRTRAAGQPPFVDTLRLVRERGRYRIDALTG
jgi:hypothetical protein